MLVTPNKTAMTTRLARHPAIQPSQSCTSLRSLTWVGGAGGAGYNWRRGKGGAATQQRGRGSLGAGLGGRMGCAAPPASRSCGRGLRSRGVRRSSLLAALWLGAPLVRRARAAERASCGCLRPPRPGTPPGEPACCGLFSSGGGGEQHGGA